jgi:hypothetical protein
MLDFCLDDGERLLHLKQKNEDFNEISPTQAKTVALNKNFNPAVFSAPDTKIELQNDLLNDLETKSEGIKQKVRLQWLKTLEIVPIILALIHNYWQWLYLARKSYYDFTSFFFSLDFIVWLILLMAGAVFGIISLKYSKSKGFAITALVVLAINVILSIVPK